LAQSGSARAEFLQSSGESPDLARVPAIALIVKRLDNSHDVVAAYPRTLP